VIGAAWYLTRRSLANSARARMRRLRQPKYAAAFAAGALYLWLMFLRQGSPGTAVSLLAPETRETMAVLVEVVVLLVTWTASTTESPFPFTLAETQFLFAAPLTRRQVMLFKIFRSQVALATSAVITVFLLRRGAWGLATVTHALGLWLAYATLNLNSAGMGLLRLSLAQHGVVGARRRLGTLLVLGAGLGGAWWVARRDLPGIETAFAHGFGAGLEALTTALHSGPGAVLSWPLRAVADPLLARTPGELVAALPPALLIFGLHVWWVVGSSLAFEEAATDAAVRRAGLLAGIRQGRGWTRPRDTRTHPLTSSRLAPAGGPEGAFVWKNVLGVRREFSPRSLIVIVIATVGGVASLRGGHLPASEALGAILLFAAGLVTLLGPIALRFDLRRDLELLEVLKTYPVRGRAVIAGEAGALLLTLSAAAGALVTAAFLVTLTDAALPDLSDRAAILAALLTTIPSVIAVFLLVQNAAVLVFPAWVTVGPQRAAGLEATGQRMLLTLGSLLALAVALVPATAAILGISWGLGRAGLDGPWGMTAGVAGGAAVIGGECWFAVQLLGGVFDRMDPSSAGIP